MSLPSEFTPADIPGLRLWLKADALALTDGAAVASWPDSSGQANHVTQGTAGSQPTKQSVTNNGRTFAVAQFDGGDVLQRAAFPVPQLYTLYAVAKTTAEGFQSVLDADINTPRVFQFRYNGSTLFEFLAWASGGLSTEMQAVVGGGFSVVSAVRRSSEAQLYVNGASGGATATTGTANGPTSATLGVGGRGTGTFLTGQIAAALVYSGAHTDAVRQQLERYLGGQFGVTVL